MTTPQVVVPVLAAGAAPCLLSAAEAKSIARKYGTPTFVYDLERVANRARLLLGLPHTSGGLTIRFAMKANPCAAILACLKNVGVSIDASSEHEVKRALRAGFSPASIQLTSQYPVPQAALKALIERGVSYNACSLLQLKNYVAICPAGGEVTIRVNPGIGSGMSMRTSVGGFTSSFGIWHEYIPEAMAVATAAGVTIRGVHTHIGSGTDPDVWNQAAALTLGLVASFLPDVTTVSLGGGFKVDRMKNDAVDGIDMVAVAEGIKRVFQEFEAKTGRVLHLELEPGTLFVANAGCVVATCIDVVMTHSPAVKESLEGPTLAAVAAAAVRAGHAAGTPTGYTFAKLDAGMNQVLRPSLYGAQHPIFCMGDRHQQQQTTAAATAEEISASDAAKMFPVVFVGPCCESGDILTPTPGDPEGLRPRLVAAVPEPGEVVVLGGCGAYCSAMSTTHYNSYPEAPEVALAADGSRTWQLVRPREPVEHVWASEDIDSATRAGV